MARYTEPICRRCRKVGEKLYLKGERCLSVKCALTQRSYPPGKKGAQGSSRSFSDYGNQLSEKQKIKENYGLLERQFKNYFIKAAKTENTALSLLTSLEMRLDNVLKVAGFFPSIRAARQMIVHHGVLINNKRIKSPNFATKVGDTINFIFKPEIKNFYANCPSWLKRNDKSYSVEVKSTPNRNDISQDFKEDLVVELYSR